MLSLEAAPTLGSTPKQVSHSMPSSILEKFNPQESESFPSDGKWRALLCVVPRGLHI